jgi:tetratricopeptide (TPR) repeat protein
MRRRDYSAARAEYDIAYKNDPGNPYALRHITECLTEIELYDEAVKYGLLAVEHDPKYAGSYRRLADAYISLGDFENALENYRKAIAHAEGNPVNFLSLAQTLILRGEPDDLEVIIDTLNQAMGYDAPDDRTRAKYLRYKGDACLRFEEYRQAATWYEQALRFDPENEELRWMLKQTRHLANK